MPRLTRSDLKPYFAEFIGTALIVSIDGGIIAQCLLSDYLIPRLQSIPPFQSSWH